jgi:hypothetical protein
MARVTEELELVAMKAVAAVGEHVKQRDCGCDANENCPRRPALDGDQVWTIISCV